MPVKVADALAADPGERFDGACRGTPRGDISCGEVCGGHWMPTGLFYGQGVKANLIFFDKKPAGVYNPANRHERKATSVEARNPHPGPPPGRGREESYEG